MPDPSQSQSLALGTKSFPLRRSSATDWSQPWKPRTNELESRCNYAAATAVEYRLDTSPFSSKNPSSLRNWVAFSRDEVFSKRSFSIAALNSRSSCSLMISSDKGSRFGSVVERTIDRISKSSIIRALQTREGSLVEFCSTIPRLSPYLTNLALGLWLLGALA